MSILLWIVLGLAAGILASKIVNRQGAGILTDIMVGIVGALLGGFIFEVFRGTGSYGLNLRSILAATVGAIALLLVVNFFRHND